MKKMIICDIDGTLAKSDTEVTDDMLEVISKLQEKYTFVTMGNGTFNHLYNQFVRKYQEKVGKELYIFALGGLEGYKLIDEGVLKIYSNDLSFEEKTKIIRTISECIKKYNLVPDTYDQIEERGSMVVFSIIGRKADKKLKKEFDPTKEKRKKLIKEFFKPRLPEFEMVIGGTTTIDFTKKGFNKSFGIKKVKEIFGYEYDEMIYFGDDLQKGGNDYAVKEFVEAVEVKNPDETLIKLKEFL